ncbi:MAG: thiamine biosynthesis protein [Desulfuromonadaceae bacterium]
MNTNVKALGIFSGGLDSILAALLLRAQGIEVHCVTFVTPFFDAEKAKEMAQHYHLPLQIQDISTPHLAMLKNPRYGYGRNMNPCIDCHAQMFSMAAQIMEREGYDFLFSGEVIGQRPKSQNRSALQAVNKASGCGDKILRPLSAKCLSITAMEEEGLVDRERLESIQGRSRKGQERLAQRLGVDKAPSAGGGCLLTENSFSNRLRDLFVHQPDCTPRDVELLKHGRAFRLSDTAQLSLGRKKSDNETLRALAAGNLILMRNENCSGPAGVLSGTPTQEDIELGAALVAAYGKYKNEDRVEVRIENRSAKPEFVEVEPLSRERALDMQL